MKKAPEQKKTRIEKSTVIALAAAAIVFLALLFFINSKRASGGASGDASADADERVDFERGVVTAILGETLDPEEFAEGAYNGGQDIEVLVKSGIYKGETMEVRNYFAPNTGVPVSEGDSVILTIKTRKDGSHSATVYEFDRIAPTAFFVLLFFAAVILVGKLTGFKSLIGLIFTVICLFTILIPLLLLGAPTILTTFAVCAFIAFVSFTIIGGVHRKTLSAFLGTAAGMLLAMIFGMAVQRFAKIDGLRLEDAEPLLQLRRYYGGTIRIKGLLTASIIISALGAVMDVAISISSSLEEVHAANPQLTRNQLFRSGMNIGRDMAGTMTNTLILALLGSEFTLIIYLYSRGLQFYHLFSTSFVILETISGISSSIGMMLAIPLTALISSALISKKSRRSGRK